MSPDKARELERLLLNCRISRTAYFGYRNGTTHDLNRGLAVEKSKVGAPSPFWMDALRRTYLNARQMYLREKQNARG